MKIFRKMLKSSKGATAIEYGLIAALIAVASIGAFSALGGEIRGTMGDASGAMDSVN